MENKSDIFLCAAEENLFVFNQSMEEIYIIAPDGSIAAANAAASAGIGYPNEELLRMKFNSIDGNMRFDIPGWFEDFISRIKQTGGFTFESLHRMKNNDERFKQVKVSCTHKAGTDYLCLFALDISGRMKSELDILRSRERFRNLFEQSFDMIFLIDRNGKVIEWNQTIETLSGIKKIDAVDRDVWDIINTTISPEMPGETNIDVIRTREKYARVIADLKNGITTEELFQSTTRTPDGVIHHVEHAFFPVTNPRDSEVMLGNILRDVTAQRVTENNLKEQQGLLSAIIDHLPFNMWARDMSGNYIFQSTQSIGTWGDLKKSESGVNRASSLWEHCCANAYNGETLHEEISFTFNGETRDFYQIIAPFYSGTVMSGIIGLHIDITEKNRMKSEHLKMQKLESLGILAGGIAHDFRNILAAILGNVTLSLMTVDKSSHIHRYLKNAENSILRAKDLTGQLLTFSKGGDPVKSLSSVTEIIRETVSMISGDTSVEFNYSFDATIPMVKIDRIQISQAIQNIALNAIQAMNGKGYMSVQTSCEDVTHEINPLLTPGRYIRIAISDTGPGIDDSILEKIFDPYFTTKNHGTGLGLSVVYSVMKKHNGLVSVDSRKGEGTTFSLFIPCATDSGSVPAEHPHGLIPGAGNILVVDDDETVRTVTRELLEQLGYRTETASTIDDATELYSVRNSLGVGFDAVIMDLSIPGGKNGIEGIRILREQDPEVKVIVISGLLDNPVFDNPQSHGFTDALTKPVNIAELSRILHNLIGGHQLA